MNEVKRRDFLALGVGMVTGIVAEGIGIDPQVIYGSNQFIPSVSPEWNAKSNSLCLHASSCDIPEWKLAVEVENELLRSEDAQTEIVHDRPLHLKLHFAKQQLSWDLECRTDTSGDRILLASTLRNESQRALRLGKAFLLQSDAINGFYQPGDAVVYLPMSSGQQLNQVRDLISDGTRSDIAIQAFNQSQNKALQIGFASFIRAKTQVEHHCSTRQGLQMHAWCDFNGWELLPGSSTPTETFTLAIGEDPRAQLESWAETAARLCRVRPREWEEQAHGWVGGSWVDPLYVERYEDVILRNARSIHKRLAGFGIEYIWESIGNLKDGQPGDWLSWNKRYFPNGHTYLQTELNRLGMKWGLWCGAFMLSSKLEGKVQELWEGLFKEPDGKQPMVYMPDWGYGLDSPTEDYKKPIYALDPSHPKILQFLTEVFSTYRGWGVRYYMIDFLWAGSDTLSDIPHAKHYDPSLVSGPEVLQRGLHAIRQACGEDTFLLGATGPTFHAAGALDAMRVGNDFGEGRPIGIGFDIYPATYALKPARHWSGPVHALSNQAATYHTHRKLYINDSGNVLTIDKPLQLNRAQINATIHAMSGGPSMLGDDMTYIEDERLSLIKKTLPRPQEVAVPIDLFTRKDRGYPRIYHRRIANSGGAYDVLAIYNLEPRGLFQQELNLSLIGLGPDRKYHVWEFWNSEYVGRVSGHLSVEIPANTVKVYRLTEDTGQPVVLGTDMHLLMGEVEIERCFWNPKQKSLSGRAVRPIGERGSVFLYAPPELGVFDPKGLFLGKDLENDCLVIRCPLRFDQGAAEWNVRFYDLTVQAPQAPQF